MRSTLSPTLGWPLLCPVREVEVEVHCSLSQIWWAHVCLLCISELPGQSSLSVSLPLIWPDLSLSLSSVRRSGDLRSHRVFSLCAKQYFGTHIVLVDTGVILLSEVRWDGPSVSQIISQKKQSDLMLTSNSASLQPPRWFMIVTMWHPPFPLVLMLK